MPQSLYTPFFAEATRNVGNAFLQNQQKQQQQQQQQLIGNAYLGDESARQQLSQINPQALMAIDDRKRQREQQDFQQRGQQQKQRQELENIVEMVADKAARLPTLEQANQYADDAREKLRPIYGDVVDQFSAFTPEQYENRRQIKQVDPEQQTLDLKKQTLDIRKQEADLRKDQQKLEAETNALKREDLQSKIDARNDKIDQGKKKIADANVQATTSADSAIATVDRLLSHPGLESAVGTSSVIPTIPGTDKANFEAELDSFDSQIFLTAVKQMKGLGSLSESEGRKISAAAGAISPKMSEKAFRRSLGVIRDGFEKAKKRVDDQNATPSQPEAGNAPSVGSESMGYRFKGGDPSSPDSWEKL